MNNDPQEGDALWRLLGQASNATPSPFFARNVMREVRSKTRKRENFAFLFRLIQATAFAILLLGFGLSLVEAPRAVPIPADLVDYFDLAAGLDQLTRLEDLTPESFASRAL